MKNYAIILSAGKGTRMHTELPKCAFPLIKKPMIKYILEAVHKTDFDNPVVVVGHKKEIFEELFGDTVAFAYQLEQLGTGHAVKMAIPALTELDGNTFILCGDMPLITGETLNDLSTYHQIHNNDITVVSTIMTNPKGYGRIIRNDVCIDSIIEEKDANDEQRKITEVNTGLYCVKTKVLCEVVKKITNKNVQNEYYLTDIVRIGKSLGLKVDAFIGEDSFMFTGINDLYALSIVEAKLKMENNKKHMLNGVSITSPETVTISSEVVIETGAIIYPNTFITGDTYICAHAEIGPNTELHSAFVGKGSVVRHSVMTDSVVGEDTTVGPYAHLRNTTKIGNHCRIGNYVEVKNSQIGDGTKVSHLTYIGDTTCGKNVNWGCGTVTVNYDGKYKHRTEVGDNCFIGCNTNLIAPIKVGNNAFIAAGSTITEDVPDEAFSIARERQVTKADYAKKYPYFTKEVK